MSKASAPSRAEVSRNLYRCRGWRTFPTTTADRAAETNDMRAQLVLQDLTLEWPLLSRFRLPLSPRRDSDVRERGLVLVRRREIIELSEEWRKMGEYPNDDDDDDAAAHAQFSFMAREEINFSSLRIMSESLRVSEGRRDKNGKRKVDEEQ